MKHTPAVYTDREEQRHLMTREALADVESNYVIDHEAVRLWAESLGTDKTLPPPLEFRVVSWLPSSRKPRPY